MHRFLKDNNSQNYRSHRTNPGPNSICGSNRQSLSGFVKKRHAAGKAEQKAYEPGRGGMATAEFSFSEAEGESNLKKSRYDQEEPAHFTVPPIFPALSLPVL